MLRIISWTPKSAYKINTKIASRWPKKKSVSYDMISLFLKTTLSYKLLSPLTFRGEKTWKTSPPNKTLSHDINPFILLYNSHFSI